jgi:hypothetical protein
MLKLGKTLHKQYGPAVRVGPNEVWFDSPEAFQTIYGLLTRLATRHGQQPGFQLMDMASSHWQ